MIRGVARVLAAVATPLPSPTPHPGRPVFPLQALLQAEFFFDISSSQRLPVIRRLTDLPQLLQEWALSRQLLSMPLVCRQCMDPGIPDSSSRRSKTKSFIGFASVEPPPTRRQLVYTYTVEPIFNDISNSDNCCYNDRFANPRLFLSLTLSLSRVIYFYNNEYKNRFPLL